MRKIFVVGCLPQRYVVAILCFMGLTISYVMRFCLSLTMIEMSEAIKIKEDASACPFPPSEEPTNSTKVAEFQWSEEIQGLIHSSFFWGYVVCQMPGGLLADRIGARYVIIIGVLLTSIFSILTPFAAQIGDYVGIIIVRVIIGLSQGLVYPSLHTVVAQWIPKKERATWATVVFSGSHAGNAINYLASGFLMGHLDLSWHYVFHIYGGIGLLWTLIFVLCTYATPREHPYLSEREKADLAECMDADNAHKAHNMKTPWSEILTSLPVWAIIIGMIGHDWGLFAMITDLPKFMKSVLHFNVKKNGMLNALNYILIWMISIGSGVLVDFLERRKVISTTANRKLGTTIASVGPSLGLLGSVYSNCDTTLAVIYLVVGMAFMGFFYPSLKVNVIDLAPNHSGTIAALTTTIGSLSGVLVPYLIGYLTPNSSLIEWRLVMWISFFIMSITNIFYVFFATSQIQSWNYPPNLSNHPRSTGYDNPTLTAETKA